MAFTVQDDAGSEANANAYVTLNYMVGYFTDRGNSIDDTYDDEAIQGAIVKATDHVDIKFEKSLGGERLTTTQETVFPRKNFYDINGKNVSSQIPIGVKKAVCEYAYAALTSDLGDLLPNPVYDESGHNVKSKKERVEGAVSEETVYKDDYIFNLDKKYPKADLYMYIYLTKQNGSSYSFLRG